MLTSDVDCTCWYSLTLVHLQTLHEGAPPPLEISTYSYRHVLAAAEVARVIESEHPYIPTIMLPELRLSICQAFHF